MNGKYKDTWFLWLALAVSLLTATSSALAAEKVKIGTALKTHPVFSLPMLAAEEKGFWKQQALEAEWVPFKGGGRLGKGLAAGAVHMAIDGVAGAVISISRGIPIIIVSHLGVPDMWGIWVRADSPVRNPRDLKGKKINVGRKGATAHAYARAATRALGIEREVRFIGLGGVRQSIAALKSGTVDAVTITFFAIAPLWDTGQARQVLKIEDHLAKRWITRVVNSRKDFLARQPQDVEKMVKAILAATDFIMKNKDWAMARMQSFLRYTPSVAKAIYPILKFSPDGRIDKQGLSNVRQFFIDSGVIKPGKAPPVEELYTTRFTG